MKTYGSDYAHPTGKDEILYENATGGLTKREHFAAIAMQGLLGDADNTTDFSKKYLAQESVKYADALIEELNKGK